MPSRSRMLKQELIDWKEQGPLRTWRLAQGLSLHDVATLLNVGVTQVQLMEAGTAHPAAVTLDACARLMEVDRATLKRRWDRWLANRPGLGAA